MSDGTFSLNAAAVRVRAAGAATSRASTCLSPQLTDELMTLVWQTFVGPAAGGFYVAALVVEIVLFGAFVGTYAYGSWLILYRAHPAARRQTSTVVLFAANTMMFILSLVVRRCLSTSTPPMLHDLCSTWLWTSRLLGEDSRMPRKLWRRRSSCSMCHRH